MTPTGRSLVYLRELGYTVAVAEKWNPYARIRQDLFGFIDVAAIRADVPGVLAVQCTTRANQAARATKIASFPAARTWLDCGNRIEIHGWAKVGPRGKRKLWEVKVTEISLSMLSAGLGEGPAIEP